MFPRGYRGIPTDHRRVLADTGRSLGGTCRILAVNGKGHEWDSGPLPPPFLKSFCTLSLSPPLRHRSGPPLLPRPRPNSKLSTPLLDTLIPTPSSLLKLRSCHIRSPLLRKSASNIFEGLSVGLVLLICECVVECC